MQVLLCGAPCAQAAGHGPRELQKRIRSHIAPAHARTPVTMAAAASCVCQQYERPISCECARRLYRSRIRCDVSRRLASVSSAHETFGAPPRTYPGAEVAAPDLDGSQC